MTYPNSSNWPPERFRVFLARNARLQAMSIRPEQRDLFGGIV